MRILVTGKGCVGPAVIACLRNSYSDAGITGVDMALWRVWASSRDAVLTYDDVQLPEGRLSDKLRAEQPARFSGDGAGNPSAAA